MSDLISRAEVEKVIKEFNHQRLDRIPPNLSQEQHCNICDTVLDENVELLDAIYALPTAYDVEKVVERLDSKIQALGGASGTDVVQDTAVKELMWCMDIARNGGKD